MKTFVQPVLLILLAILLLHSFILPNNYPSFGSFDDSKLSYESNQGYHSQRTTPTIVRTVDNYQPVLLVNQSQSNEIPPFLRTYVQCHNQAIVTTKQRRPDRAVFAYTVTESSTSDGEQQHCEKNQRYLLWSCRRHERCGGLGDRIHGIVTAFYQAFCLNRVFLIEWDDLEEYVQPHFVHWKVHRLPVAPSQLYVTTDDRQSKILREPDVMDRNAQGIQVLHNLWLGEEVVQASQCWKRVVPHDTSSNGHLFAGAFTTLFSWSPRVQQRARQLRDQAQLHQPYIGMHIRTGIGTKWKDRAFPTNQHYERFYQCARRLQHGLVSRCGGGVDMYLAADTSQVKHYLQMTVNDTTLHTLIDLEVYHIDRSDPASVANASLAELDVWSELFLLSQSTCLVTTGRSKFSLLASRFVPCVIDVEDCTLAQVQRVMNQLPNDPSPCRSAAW